MRWSLSSVKSEIEHEELNSVGCFSVIYAKLRKLELYYRFFDKYCDITKFEELDMDTDSLYLVLSEHDLYDCIRQAMKNEWLSLQSGDCTDEFSASSTSTFFSRTCCAQKKKHDRRELGLFKEEICCIELICYCRKTYCF